MSKEALIIVDVQNDFCPGGSLAVKTANEITWRFNTFIEYAKERGWEIMATRDWHPKETSHFKSEKNPNGWPVHCVQGSEGAKFHPAINMDGIEVYSKGMGEDEDAYSGFDARNVEGKLLGEVLRERGVERIHIGGLATDYCVKATAIDGVKRMGFDTTVWLGISRAVNLHHDDGAKAVEEMKQSGVRIMEERYCF